MRICFLIDDDPDDRDIFEMALNDISGQYRFISAKNGINALEMINADKQFKPDFIFIDLNMPLMSGKECLKQIRGKSHLANTPVIIYTTSSYQKDIEETRNLGATHFLVKPPALGSLILLLSDIINKKEIPYCLGGSN